MLQCRQKKHTRNNGFPSGNGGFRRFHSAAACGSYDMQAPSAAAYTITNALHSPQGNLKSLNLKSLKCKAFDEINIKSLNQISIN